MQTSLNDEDTLNKNSWALIGGHLREEDRQFKSECIVVSFKSDVMSVSDKALQRAAISR